MNKMIAEFWMYAIMLGMLAISAVEVWESNRSAAMVANLRARVTDIESGITRPVIINNWTHDKRSILHYGDYPFQNETIK